MARLGRFRRINVDHVKLPQHLSVEEALEIYRNDPDVEYVEPNYYLYAVQTFPNDPNFGELWGLDNFGQTGGTLDADIDAPEAWDVTTGDAHVVIAVIDTGVDYNHPDLAANMWINGGEVLGDGVDNDGNGYVDDVRGWDFEGSDNDPMDPAAGSGHGTHVTGIIAAVGDNNTGVTGVNWAARIMPLRFLDTSGEGTSVHAVLAIEYASGNGAHIINCSWGGYNFSQAIQDAIDASPALVVCAAGNDDNNNDLVPFYPASCSGSNVISVAATNHNDARFFNSNFGAVSVDVGAPGVWIYGTVPVASGIYDYKTGTSMAAPHVSGIAALLLAYDPTLTVAEIGTAIESTVDPIPLLEVASGGRVNAYNALDSLISPPDAPSDPVAVPLSGSSIRLTWTDNSSDEHGFIVERKTGIGGGYSDIETIGANTSTLVDSGLDEQTTYYYRVRAYNPAGESLPSAEANATTLLATPLNLTAEAVSTSQIRLRWKDESDLETGFRIERKRGSGGAYSEIALVDADSGSYTDRELASGVTYHYRVRADGITAQSNFSNEATATTLTDGGGGGGCFIGTLP
jgi:subtilisin family serine protease